MENILTNKLLIALRDREKRRVRGCICLQGENQLPVVYIKPINLHESFTLFAINLP